MEEVKRWPGAECQAVASGGVVRIVRTWEEEIVAPVMAAAVAPAMQHVCSSFQSRHQ